MNRFIELIWHFRFVASVVFAAMVCHADMDRSAIATGEEISWKAAGNQGAVCAGRAAAVEAGLEILVAGGNAADSSIATLLALSVTDSMLFCFGGEVPILVYDARRGTVEVVCGQGAAPRLATREFFLDKGGIPRRGKLAPTVPAVLGACVTTLDRYGTLTFAEAAAPALRLLDAGKAPWHRRLAKTMRRLCQAESASPDDRSVGLHLVADCFYRGEIAREIDAWSRDNGALIRYTDLATHVTRIEQPLSIQYRGHTVYKCGVWTQGPCLLETLALLEGFDLAALGQNRPDAIHLMTESMKLAFADRDTYYADPHFVDVPIEQLLAPSYTAARRELISRESASLVYQPGDPRRGRALSEESAAHAGAGGTDNDTTTCVVADRWGNVVAATPSGWYGVEAGETGVWLGTRLQSFNTWQGHPNCIEPGKRPRITLTPTLVLRDGKPLLAVSVAGGDGQDQAALQLIVNEIDFHLDPADSVTAPRFGTAHHVSSFGQGPPKLGSLLLQPELAQRWSEEMSSRGHVVKIKEAPLWAPSMIRIDPKSGKIQAAGDPAAGRHAAAF